MRNFLNRKIALNDAYLIIGLTLILATYLAELIK